MPVKKNLLLTCGVVAISTCAIGGYWMWSGRNILSDSFCTALAEKSTYEENGLEPYTVLIPGKDGWIFRTENDFRTEWTINEKTTSYLLSLQNAFASHNATLVIVMPPVRGLVHADKLNRKYKKKFDLKNIDAAWKKYELSIQELQSKGINIISIDKADITSEFYYARNHHWTASGARTAAIKVAQVVQKLPVYEKIQKQKFTSAETGLVEYKSSFEKAFRKICDTNVPVEMARHYETSPVSESGNGDQLFNDPIKPQVVLLGTSNSVPESSEANFTGFLKEAISSDIQNFAYIGAGIDTSIMSFLASDSFKDNQPKIVIWEVPGYYDFNVMDDKLFNQIIPAAYGLCSAETRYEKLFQAVPGGQTVLFDLIKPLAIDETIPEMDHPEQILNSGSGLYIHLGFATPIHKKFSLKFQYENGGTKKQDFTPADEYKHNGHFYTLLPDKAGVITQVSLSLPAETPATDISVHICQLPPTIAP